MAAQGRSRPLGFFRRPDARAVTTRTVLASPPKECPGPKRTGASVTISAQGRTTCATSRSRPAQPAFPIPALTSHALNRHTIVVALCDARTLGGPFPVPPADMDRPGPRRKWRGLFIADRVLFSAWSVLVLGGVHQAEHHILCPSGKFESVVIPSPIRHRAFLQTDNFRTDSGESFSSVGRVIECLTGSA